MNFFHLRPCSLWIEVSPDSDFNHDKYFGGANFLLVFNLFWFLHFIAQLIGQASGANKVASLQMINRGSTQKFHHSPISVQWVMSHKSRFRKPTQKHFKQRI